MRLDRSVFRDWHDYGGENVHEYQLTLAGAASSPLVDGWTPEGLLSEVILQEGFPLDSTVANYSEIPANTVYRVQSEFHEFSLYVCTDDKLAGDTGGALLGLGPKDIFVCLDSALTDELKMRLADAINLHVI